MYARFESVEGSQPRVYESLLSVRGWLADAKNTLKVESFAGKNFRDFANFSVVRESLYPRNHNFQVVRESLYPRNFLKFLKN